MMNRKDFLRYSIAGALAGSAALVAGRTSANAFVVSEVSSPASAPLPVTPDDYSNLPAGAWSGQAVVDPTITVNRDAVLTDPTLSLLQKVILWNAYDGIGGAYVWGGKTYKNWDCSGFVAYVHKYAGIPIDAYTYTMVNQLTPTANPQPGDIVFQNGYSHVGIYVGGGMMVNALNPAQGTLLTAVDGGGYMSVDGYYTLSEQQKELFATLTLTTGLAAAAGADGSISLEALTTHNVLSKSTGLFTF